MRVDDGTLPTLARMRQHIVNLAADYRITICPDAHTIKQSGADPKQRRVHIPAINGPISYAIALHELGHLAHPQGTPSVRSVFYQKTGRMLPIDLDVQLVGELSAWEWAFTRALCWTDTMTRVYRHGLWTYTFNQQKSVQGYAEAKHLIDLLEMFFKAVE